MTTSLLYHACNSLQCRMWLHVEPFHSSPHPNPPSYPVSNDQRALLLPTIVATMTSLGTGCSAAPPSSLSFKTGSRHDHVTLRQHLISGNLLCCRQCHFSLWLVNNATDTILSICRQPVSHPISSSSLRSPIVPRTSLPFLFPFW
jgi:hypothetical protein